MAAREIIITGVVKSANGDLTVCGVFWLVAPANKIILKPTMVSLVPLLSAVAWGITPAELTTLQAGTLVEQAFVTGQLASPTLASVKTALQTAYAAAQTASDATNPAAKFIGSFWDGTTWTAAP